jgi:transketolase
LQKKAKEMRKDILIMCHSANSGHPGGSLSAIDILVCLYRGFLKHNPKNPKWTERDRFVLSKGHACPALYAVLADCGYFMHKRLLTFRKIDSRLQGHPSMNDTPGVEFSTGSLGQGLSGAVGMALAYQMKNKKEKIYVMLGDGECDEGQVWEAALSAAHYELDNLIAIVDANGLQIDGFTKDIMGTESLTEKFQAFNWNVIEIDGHDYKQIISAFEAAQKRMNGKPTVIIARTIKGKGVSFMENKVEWHGKAPNDEEMVIALKDLE